MSLSLHVTGRVVALLVLACDMIPGFAWTFADPIRSSSPAYARARSMFGWLPGDPARWWGSLLLAFIALALLALFLGSELAARRSFALLLAYWATWAFLYAWGAVTIKAAPIAPVGLALIACVGHWRPIAAPQRLESPHHSARRSAH